jgi:hypothetical protein
MTPTSPAYDPILSLALLILALGLCSLFITLAVDLATKKQPPKE